jgi:hypothetical protein
MVEFTHCESPFDRWRFRSAMQLAKARLEDSQDYSAGARKKLIPAKLLGRRRFLHLATTRGNCGAAIVGAKQRGD